VLLLGGDCWQLSPVCRHKISDNEEDFLSLCQHCHLLHDNNFLGATHLHLQTVYRQAADHEPFARFLHEVRTTQRPPHPAHPGHLGGLLQGA
jgi:hypothetical protein